MTRIKEDSTQIYGRVSFWTCGLHPTPELALDTRRALELLFRIRTAEKLA